MCSMKANNGIDEEVRKCNLLENLTGQNEKKKKNDDLDEAKRWIQVFKVQAYTETSSSTFFLFFFDKYGVNEGYQRLLHLFSLHPNREDAN